MLFNVLYDGSVVEIEIFSEGGGKTLNELTKHFVLYIRSVTSYIILGRSGDALRPFVTNLLSYFQTSQNLKFRH